MEAEQARELALNARLNHWPPYLGIRTDAEKLEHLATRLDEAATSMFINETLADENEALREENNWYKEKLGLRHGKIENEAFACDIAGDNYGVSLEDDPARVAQKGRLYPNERKAFEAGWEAAKQYYLNQPQVKDVQS